MGQCRLWKILEEDILTFNDGRLETEGGPATVTEGGDVLTTLSDKSQTLQRAGDLPAQD
jgi:hypothetical protein